MDNSDPEGANVGCCGSCLGVFYDTSPRRTPVKIEPKVYFANERTFLKWINIGVTLASFSVGILAFSEKSDNEDEARAYGLTLLPISTLIMIYALFQYLVRSRMIRNRDPGPYDDSYGPVFLVVLLSVVFMVNFGIHFSSTS